MSKDKCQLLTDAMGDIVAVAEKYDPLLRPTIVDNLCRAFLSDPSMPNGDSIRREIVAVASTGEALEEVDEQWDYRQEMFAIANEKDKDLKTAKQQTFVTFLAYVFEIHGPGEFRESGITPEIVVEACRATGQKQPSDAAATLRTLKSRGLLDRKSRKHGYTLAPKGENLIAKWLSENDES